MSEIIYNSNGDVTELAQTKQETDQKCPSCGGVMSYDPQSGGLACPYCGHEMSIDNVDRAQELTFEDAEKTGNCDWGVKTKTVVCKACGGESVYDALQVAGACPYCGSNQVMEAFDQDTLAPGGVCPFVVTKQTAGANFGNWIRKKWFCPSEAKRSAKPDSFQGLYLPYWTFDAHTESDYTARYGIDRTVHDGDGKSHTETDWYRTAGHYTEFIDDQLVVATTRHSEDMLLKIQPFDTANNVAYKPEYVAGYITERYAVGLKQAWERAKNFIRTRLVDNISRLIKGQHNADHVRDVKLQTVYENVTYKYLLLPVWISSFVYKGKTYQFMVNGQTGQVGGKYPISPWRVAIAIIVGLLLAIILFTLFGEA